MSMPYKTNKKKSEYMRKWRKTWSEEKKKEVATREKAWRGKNKDKVKAQKQRYYGRHSEEEKLRVHTYYHTRYKQMKKENPKRYYEMQKVQNNKARVKWLTFLNKLRQEKGGECSRCSYREEIGILQFHHFNGLKDKDMDIASMRVQSRAIEEAKKCVLLCPNCHAIEH